MNLPNPGRTWHTEKVLKWTDDSTALLYSEVSVMGNEDLWPVTAFLFTLKFDDADNWKIVKTHQMSKKELEEE
jgi:hypothetical protein